VAGGSGSGVACACGDHPGVWPPGLALPPSASSGAAPPGAALCTHDLQADGMILRGWTGVVFGRLLLLPECTWNQRESPLVTGGDMFPAWLVIEKN
jgi:hypothetical protein